MKYRRNFECAVCGGWVDYDSETETLTCKCGTVKAKVPAKDLLVFWTKKPKVEVVIEAPFGMPENTWIDYSKG